MFLLYSKNLLAINQGASQVALGIKYLPANAGDIRDAGSISGLGRPPRETESEVAQPCPTLCDPIDCSLPGSSVHGIFQARVLEWVAISFSRGSSRPRDWTRVSRIVGRCFTFCLTKEIATHSNILAWRIPWTEKSSRLWSTGPHKVWLKWLKHNQPRWESWLHLAGTLISDVQSPELCL